MGTEQANVGEETVPDGLSRIEQIKWAGAREFYAYGFAGTDLRAIAGRVGLHVSSLYNHIKSKEELLYLISRDGLDAADAALDASLAGSGDAVSRVHDGLIAYLTNHLKRRFEAGVANSNIGYLEGDHRAEIISRRRQYRARWNRLVQDAADAGGLDVPDVSLAVASLLAMAQGLSRWYQPSGPYTAEAVGKAVAEQLLNGLLTRRP